MTDNSNRRAIGAAAPGVAVSLTLCLDGQNPI